MSIYEISIMTRAFYRLGRSFLRRGSAPRVYRSIDRLYHSQNVDGGWDVNIWGYETRTPTRVWSEAGATSAVLQALAVTGDERFRQTVEKGMRWLAAAQNSEGSWNDGSCHPTLPEFQIAGRPTVTKTCDALQGILAGQVLNIPLGAYRKTIDCGMDWLHRQIKQVVDPQCHASGQGWGYTPADYENTCMTLETFLRLPYAPEGWLSCNVTWLLDTQRRQVDDPEDGGWVMGHTARIGLALAAYYRRASESAGIASVPWIP